MIILRLPDKTSPCFIIPKQENREGLGNFVLLRKGGNNQLILGIGTDIVEISRVTEAFQRTKRLAERLFTPAEREYCLGRRDSSQHFAARFAAKEAIAKAVGRSLRWQEVEIRNDRQGRPQVVLTGHAKQMLGNCRIMVSLSHSGQYAAAFAVIVGEHGSASLTINGSASFGSAPRPRRGGQDRSVTTEGGKK